MTAYQDILAPDKKLVQIEFNKPKPRAKKLSAKNIKLGCDHCPANKKGIKKLKRLKEIKGKKVFIWFRNPSRLDNKTGKNLSGYIGEWLWKELKLVGLAKSDVDFQTVVRCNTPVYNDDENYMEDKEPPTEVAKCCSKYSARALELNGGKAKVHLVFGQYAAKALLGREYKKDQPIFWSDKLQARVVCLDHPSYFLHGAPQHRLNQFRDRLKVALHSVKHSGKYSFLKSQDYQLIKTYADLKEYFKYAKKFALEKKRSIVVDIETGWLLKNYDSDKLRKLEVCAETPGVRQAMLVIGFTHAPGRARTVVLDHPDANIDPREVRRMKKAIKAFLEDEEIEKVMHYGSSDFTSTKELLDCTIKHYWFDTNYGTYLMWPDIKKYGLDNLSKEKVPEFAGYKDIIKEYLVKDKHNYATIPLKIMRLYNGADCDLTKRLEILTRGPLLKRSPHSRPLLRTYRHVAFQLMKITPKGPFLDYSYCKIFKKELKIKIKSELKALRRSCKMPDLNPRSPQQVKEVIYKKLKVPQIEVKRKIGRTDENTIKVLQAQHKHKFFDHLLEHRGLEKMRSQLEGYLLSANTYEGRLRTIWWLTGAITGRLRSGGKDEKNIVNLQNIPKVPVIKNLLISDILWRKLRRWVKLQKWARVLRRKVLLIADYSAIELRVLAELAEPKFITIFKSGKDAHGLMGANFTDWTYEQICTDEEIRTKVKNINFGVPYGMGKQSFFEGLIARGTKISRKESDELYDKYFATYDGIVRFHKDTMRFAEEFGYVETMYGFQRPILGAEDSRSTFWGNQAINSRVQGSAHQYLLFAMALLWTSKGRFDKLQEMSMEIHDALAFFCKVKDMQAAYKQLKELLEVAVPAYVKKHFKYKLKVPIPCDIKAGFRLGTMVKYKGEDPKEFIKTWLKQNKETEAKVSKEWNLRKAEAA